MSEPRSLLDPFGFWSFVGKRLEKALTEAGNRGVNSEPFAKLMHKALGGSLVAGNLTRALTQRVQEQLNVPTRSDIQALGERLQTIEDRLVGIAACMDAPRSGQMAGSTALRRMSPPRTRKAPPPEAPAPAAAKPRQAPRKTRKVRT